MPGQPQPPVSPWTWTASDFLGRTLSISVVFNNSTGALSSCSIVRQSGCLYAHIYFGIGVDGVPDDTPSQFGPVAVGTTNATAGQMAAFGFTNISQVLAGQVTAGP